ncbi:unnamed protein product, partial [Brenthis ino]
MCMIGIYPDGPAGVARVGGSARRVQRARRARARAAAARAAAAPRSCAAAALQVRPLPDCGLAKTYYHLLNPNGLFSVLMERCNITKALEHDAPKTGLPSAVEEEPIEEVEEWENHEHKNSGVLGLPTHSIYIPPARRAARDAPDDECGGWVSAASAHYVDVEAADWTLPDEAFPLRAPPAPPAPLAPPAPPHDAPAHEGAGYARAGGAGGAAAGASSPGGSSGSGSSAAPPSPTLLRPGNGSTEAGGAGEAGEALCVREARRGGALRAGPLLAAALRLHAALGDVQTAAVVCLALQDHRNDLLSYIDESMQEQWLLGYIELLQRHKMWNEATEVIRCAWVNSVWSISQQSTALTACCGRCGRRTRARAPCDTCAPRAPPDLCAVCHRAVRGLYAWCQGCAHGGHLLHMRAWAAAHRLCPAGCGHACHLG